MAYYFKTYSLNFSDKTIHTAYFEAHKEGETTVAFISSNDFNPDIKYTIKVTP